MTDVTLHDGTKVRCEKVASMVTRGGYPAAESDASIRRLREQGAGMRVHNLVRQKMAEQRVNYARALELVRTDPGNRDLMKAFNEETIRGGRG